METAILGIAYSPVRAGLSEAEIWQRTVQKKDIDPKSLQRLQAYFDEIWKSQKAGAYDGTFEVQRDDDDGSSTQETLDDMLHLEPSSQNSWEDFKEKSLGLARKLVHEMDKRSKAGYLFAMVCVSRRERYCSLLKVDLWEEIGHPTLHEDTKEIAFEVITDALPDPGDVQKGAIFPLPRDAALPFKGDMKVVQYDNTDAAYFDRFLDLKRRAAPREQFRGVVKVLDKIKENAGLDPIAPDELTHLTHVIEDVDGATVGEDDLETAFEDILGEAYDKPALRKAIRSEVGEISIPKSTALGQRIRLRIDQSIKIEAPQNAIAEGLVRWTRDRGGWRVEIRGTNLVKEVISG